MVDAERSTGIALRIQIDNEHCEAAKCESGGHVHARRGLADTSLLIRDDEDPGMCWSG
jgi:hypothetical protein